MRKPQTKADYKRRIREVKRTSQKLTQSKSKKTKFSKGNIVKLKGGEDMGYVEFYRYDKVCVKWLLSEGTSTIGYHMENELKKVI
jgi:hypothetical protein